MDCLLCELKDAYTALHAELGKEEPPIGMDAIYAATCALERAYQLVSDLKAAQDSPLPRIKKVSTSIDWMPDDKAGPS